MVRGGRILRSVLGAMSGILLANIVTTYGGVGVGLLSIAADQHTPADLVVVNIIVGVFGIVMEILLLCLAFLLFAEFLPKKIHFTKILRVVTVPSLLVFSLVHVAAHLGQGNIQHTELVNFIDGFVPYAVQTLIALALFVVVHRMTPHKLSHEAKAKGSSLAL